MKKLEAEIKRSIADAYHYWHKHGSAELQDLERLLWKLYRQHPEYKTASSGSVDFFKLRELLVRSFSNFLTEEDIEDDLQVFAEIARGYGAREATGKLVNISEKDFKNVFFKVYSPNEYSEELLAEGFKEASKAWVSDLSDS